MAALQSVGISHASAYQQLRQAEPPKRLAQNHAPRPPHVSRSPCVSSCWRPGLQEMQAVSTTTGTN
eukprot:6212517-Pleurochrysis_carterae.AAC.6